MVKVAFSPIYRYELPKGHRFPMEKYDLLPEQLVYEGTLSESDFFEPLALTEEEILITHSKEYLQKLNAGNLTKLEQRKIGFPVRPDLVQRGKHIANGTYHCALHALNNGVSLNIAGGTHHAYADRGEGFCVFNDFAIASNLLLSRNLVKKILIVDLDVHQGNGNAHIFKGRDNVFTLSMHGEKNYPLKKERSDLDIGLPDGITDEPYLTLLRNHLPKVIDMVEPDFIFYQAGVDIIETDKLGRLKVTKDGCIKRDRFVFESAKKNGIPVAVSMGGGYSHRVSDIVDAHANTFRIAVELFD
jgi:acetoin utilization deacetylase AcuC-like enzyme